MNGPDSVMFKKSLAKSHIFVIHIYSHNGPRNKPTSPLLVVASQSHFFHPVWLCYTVLHFRYVDAIGDNIAQRQLQLLF